MTAQMHALTKDRHGVLFPNISTEVQTAEIHYLHMKAS